MILCAFITAAAAQPQTQCPLAISGVTVIDPNVLAGRFFDRPALDRLQAEALKLAKRN